MKLENSKEPCIRLKKRPQAKRMIKGRERSIKREVRRGEVKRSREKAQRNYKMS